MKRLEDGSAAQPLNPVVRPQERLVDSPKLYTPLQIRSGSFFGGPFAPIYLLRENFVALGRNDAARLTLLFGAAFIVVVLATLPFLPDRFPRYVLPLAYSISAGAIAERWQLGKAAILESSQYQIQSTWRVACLGVILLIAFLVVAFMELFGLDALGVIVL